jgi:hypothetical protein
MRALPRYSRPNNSRPCQFVVHGANAGVQGWRPHRMALAYFVKPQVGSGDAADVRTGPMSWKPGATGTTAETTRRVSHRRSSTSAPIRASTTTLPPLIDDEGTFGVLGHGRRPP